MQAPMISTMSRGYLSSESEKIIQIKNDFEEAVKAQYHSDRRGARAWEVYEAIDGGQYEDKKRRIFKEEDRKPWQFNFAAAKTDALAGSIVAELPDPDWTPVVGDTSTLTEAIKETYINDKDLFNYSKVLIDVIRDGCVHSGWYEIGISRKYHPAGNINLMRLRPGFFIPDPYWVSDDDLDLMCAYKIGYFNVMRMKHIWNAKGDEISNALQDFKKGRFNNPPKDLIDQQLQYRDQVGDEYRVIEKHYLDITETIRLIGLKKGANTLVQKLSWVPFPVTEKRAILEKFAEINDIDWETVQEVPYEQRLHKVTTITDLMPGKTLEDRISNVQCNSLPFGHYSTSRVNGHDKGIVESIVDLQEMLNERMSHVHEMIAKASGGASIYNEQLFRNNQEKQDFVKKKNKPGHSFFGDLDGVNKVKEDIYSIQVNPAIFQQVSVIYNELLPLISRVSDTMSAISGSEDTGVLFERKYQMNKIANILFDKSAKQFINNVGERYFYLWQRVYAGLERDIKTRRGNIITLNKRTDAGVLNSVAHVPRCRVVINENFASSTYQMRQRMQVQDIIKSIPEGDYLRLNAALGIYFSSIDMADRDKAIMEMVTELNNVKSQLQFMTDISGMQAQVVNNKAMAEQAQLMILNIQNQMQAVQAQSNPNAPQQMVESGNVETPVNYSEMENTEVMQ